MTLVLVFAGTAMAFDYVDIGGGETHTMTSWGPPEPATHPGNFGGIAPGSCRAIWTNFDYPGLPYESRSATVEMWFTGLSEQVAYRHLEGVADDGFHVYIDDNWKFTHPEAQTTEVWINSGFNTTESMGFHTIKFVAMGDKWSGWATWGQVCFDWVEVGGGAIDNEVTSWSAVKNLYR